MTINVQNALEQLASKLPTSISNFIGDIISKREDVVLGPFDLFVRMQQEAPEELSGLPRVGTSHKDVPAVNNPETFQAFDTEKQANVEHNAFTVYFSATEIGQNWQNVIADIKLAMKPETQNESKIYKDHAHDTAYLKDELNLYTQRMSRGRSMVRQAARIRDVLEDLSEHDGIDVRYNTYVDGKGETKMKRSHYPFRLVDMKDQSIFKPLTISDLLKFNRAAIAKAVANGGTHQAFVNAIARQKPEKSDDKQVKVVVGSIQELESYIAGVTNYLDLRSKEGREHETALRALLTAKRAENESLIEQIGTLYHSLGSLYSIIEPAYNRLVDKKAAANAA